MKFRETELQGAYLIELTRLEDDRGFFGRSFCGREFKKRNLEHRVAQCNISYNNKRGTVRGMHYQSGQHAEAKLVRCTRGSISDIIIDIRKNSATFMQWQSFELSEETRNALYIPEGFAHGFQTLVDNTEVFYQMFDFYEPGYAEGIRWNDPAFDISWPLPITEISEKDENYSDFDKP